MAHILTADQFVVGLISTLALKNRKRFVFKASELDEMFLQAFEDLISREATFNIKANFTFYTDPLHGDSATLRETLMAAHEKELISLNNPMLNAFDIQLDECRAKIYLEKLPLPQEFFSEVVEKYFPVSGAR